MFLREGSIRRKAESMVGLPEHSSAGTLRQDTGVYKGYYWPEHQRWFDKQFRGAVFGKY